MVLGTLPGPYERSCAVSARSFGLVDRCRLSGDNRSDGLAALGADIVRVDASAAVRTVIGTGFDERPRTGDDGEDALVERLGRDRLGHELGDAGVACFRHALFFGMGRTHDDWRLG